MSSLPLKVALGDLTALEVAHPTATRSGIIRALVVGTVAKGTPLVVPPFTPPSASTWTTISVDSGTELLVTKAFQVNNVKNLSALVFNAVRDTFVDYRQEIVLTGHSGGGSLTFGYLNAVEKISSDIKRIAFLDSNYAFETTNHLAKLVNWLKETNEASLTNRSVPVPGHSNAVRLISSEQFQAARNLNIAAPEDGRTPQGEGTTHYLCVLAYHDSIALLDGKTFVSERGGTWGRSHAMLEDLRHEFPFTSSTNSAGLQSHVAANGRIQLLLKENPEKKILHTVQVDRNGFIHAMLTGTPLENRGYEYFGERAYERWIQEE